MGRLEPLIPLFAPYCGGVAYQHLLVPAMQQLLEGECRGERPVGGVRSHHFLLRWQGEPAPLEPLACTLEFPALPGQGYSFQMPAYLLVYWLMQRQGSLWPDAFWRWLFTGELPAAGDGVSQGAVA